MARDSGGVRQSADQIVETYVRLRERLESAPSTDFVEIRGERCARCGGGPPTRIRTDSGERPVHRGTFSTVCSDCRKPWDGHELQIFRGEIQSSVRGNPEGAFSELADVAKLIVPVPRGTPASLWRHAVLCLAVYATRVNSVLLVCEWGREHQPGMAWSEATVKRRIALARTVICKRAGIAPPQTCCEKAYRKPSAGRMT